MTSIVFAHWIRGRRQLAAGMAAVLLAAGLGGCATAPPPPPVDSAAELPFGEAVASAADRLFMQVAAPPGRFAAARARQGVVLDPMIDAGSGQQTATTQQLAQQVLARMNEKFAALELLPFEAPNLERARYLLTGTMTRVAPGQPRGPLRIDLALTAIAPATVAAQATALARDEGLDHMPLPHDRDTPVPARDAVVEGYVRTTAAPVGQRADARYIERLPSAPALQQAAALYNAARYEEAGARYRDAGDAGAGEQLRVLNGLYLTASRLGRQAEAEQAFARIVAHGLANRELGIKFLFNPGGTNFWSEPRISGPYAMWLREIARASAGANVCMAIVGHTSHTGTAAFNDALSLQRARFVQQRLVGESTALRDRTTPSGQGFRQNLVGSGTDDAVDALDRRVEFRIVECG